MRSITSKIFFLFLFFSLTKVNFAQVGSIPYYNNLNFNGAFAVISESNAKSDFYTVDLSSFKSAFEKKYFENLAFSESKIVRIDAGNPDVAWFKVDKSFTKEEILKAFEVLRERAIQQASTLSEEQKQNWLLKGK